MRTVSAKRTKRLAECRAVRQRWVAEAKACWICGHGPARPHRGRLADLSNLCVHEILNGPLRALALDKAFARLVICWYCNGYVVTNKKDWPEARQLAVLLAHDPDGYDLVAFNKLANPRAPNRVTQSEVEQWLRTN